MCPVTSFKLYMSKLNPAMKWLWQRPLEHYAYDDPSWYYNSPVGVDTLGKMMGKLSTAANLSKEYTNHCLRSTCITVLDGANIASRHIQAISRHASEKSIASYSTYLPESKSREIASHMMAYTIGAGAGSALHAPTESVAIQPPPPSPQLAIEATPSTPPLFDYGVDPLDYSPLLSNSQFQETLSMLNTPGQNVQMAQPPPSLFSAGSTLEGTVSPLFSTGSPTCGLVSAPSLFSAGSPTCGLGSAPSLFSAGSPS